MKLSEEQMYQMAAPSVVTPIDGKQEAEHILIGATGLAKEIFRQTQALFGGLHQLKFTNTEADLDVILKDVFEVGQDLVKIISSLVEKASPSGIELEDSTPNKGYK